MDYMEMHFKEFLLFNINNILKAKPETILKAVDIMNPPTITNLICMAALYGGSHKRVYSEKEIKLI